MVHCSASFVVYTTIEISKRELKQPQKQQLQQQKQQQQ